MSDQLTLVCDDLSAALDLFTSLGLRLDVIYPADDPHTAVIRHGHTTVRLTTAPEAPAPSADLPPFVPEFVLTRAGASPGQGRAGMLYRDLIPSRLGGRWIASHITIPTGGPVADWVHYHRIRFQMIFVRRGWVRVVYEDQGEPFVMHAGDCVLQPPGIRHRVLEGSPGLEVVEVGAPALHETFADHEMVLPNGRIDRSRDFGSQRFLRHVAAEASWTPFHGFEARDTGMADATGGLADVRVLRPAGSDDLALPPHHGELQFGFVLEGSGGLDGQLLGPTDAFVLPPGRAATVSGGADLELLLVRTVAV